MKKNIELTPKIIKAVSDHIMYNYGLTRSETADYIIENSSINNQTYEEYIFDYYNNNILKDNKNNINNADNSIDDVDKVNFEELTETDKKVIASRKYMCHEYVKDIIQDINKLINVELSNDRHAVDETAVIMYAIQAITRDVTNAISDTRKILKLIKQKRP